MSAVPAQSVPSITTDGKGGWNALALDGGFVLLLGVLGLYSFRSLYGGWQFLLVGATGLIIGVAVSAIAVSRRAPVLAEAVVVAAAFLVIGGVVAARTFVIAGVVPTGHSIAALGRVGVFGWKELLTTAPPVGNSGNLLAIPYLIGLIGGVVGMSLASRTKRSALPILGPVAVLSLGILFGPTYPTSLLVQGTFFAGGAIAWTSLRYHRQVVVVAGTSINRGRLVMAATTVVGVCAVSGLAGPMLPGADSHQRTVLSRYVVPPFDVDDLSSPLSTFREFTRTPSGSLYDKTLFVVHGYVPQRIRIATMDAYDGLTWGFGGTGQLAPDTFQRFGSVIPSTPGRDRTMTITMSALGGIWMPEAGSVTGIRFLGQNSTALDAGVRYDLATATAAQPDGLPSGTRYSLNVVPSSNPRPQVLDAAASGGVPVSFGLPPVVKSDATSWSGVGSPWERVQHIATKLKSLGYYSDGLAAGRGSPVVSLPGHDAGRLESFLNGGGVVGTQIVGDDEQYAATMALMAEAIGVPARVVLGVDPVPADGQVMGSDVHAWVEVEMAGAGWVTVPWQSFTPSTNKKPQVEPPAPKPKAQATVSIQPAPSTAIRSPFADQLPGFNSDPSLAKQGGSSIPWWLEWLLKYVLPPLVLIGSVTAGISLTKWRRRRRRLNQGAPSVRLAAGWTELCDFQRDLGRIIPGRLTRKEQVDFVPVEGAGDLAVSADRAVFGPVGPTVEDVAAYWAAVDQVITAARSQLSRLQRWRSRLSLRSLLPPSRPKVV